MKINFYGEAAPLTLDAYQNAALAERLEVAAMRAVTAVESGGHGFLPDKRPIILQEAKVFSGLTDHRYDHSHPHISSPIWDRTLYGAAGAHQYDRLTEAMALDESAALQSVSVGLFQVMGFNYKKCGFATVQGFMQAQTKSEFAHLLAFLNFCDNTHILDYLRQHQWTQFALRYNGVGERANHYDDKLKLAYQKYSVPALSAGQPAEWLAHAEHPGAIGMPWQERF